MYALNGRVGLVTGAGGGIGRAIARRLTREGMAIAVLDRDGAAAKAIAGEIGGLAVTADATSEDEVGRAVEAVLAGHIGRFVGGEKRGDARHVFRYRNAADRDRLLPLRGFG